MFHPIEVGARIRHSDEMYGDVEGVITGVRLSDMRANLLVKIKDSDGAVHERIVLLCHSGPDLHDVCFTVDVLAPAPRQTTLRGM